MLSQRKSKDSSDAEPLKATVYDLSRTGNLTIKFSKPIIKPPIEIHSLNNKTDAAGRRLLPDFKLIPVNEVVNITVESYFYGDESDKVQIVDYVATRLTTTSLDIQIDFKHPDALT